MVRRPIAFDREDRPTWLLWVHGYQIDAIAGGAELRSRPDAPGLQRIANIGLKRIEANFSRVLFFGHPPATACRIL